MAFLWAAYKPVSHVKVFGYTAVVPTMCYEDENSSSRRRRRYACVRIAVGKGFLLIISRVPTR